MTMASNDDSNKRKYATNDAKEEAEEAPPRSRRWSAVKITTMTTTPMAMMTMAMAMTPPPRQQTGLSCLNQSDKILLIFINAYNRLISTS
jgi:hypothetical protein